MKRDDSDLGTVLIAGVVLFIIAILAMIHASTL